MTRLIDADSIPWEVAGVGEIPVITKEEIDQMPTVDAVPVIRCKDCKYFYKEERYCVLGTVAISDGYCYLGERKNDIKSIYMSVQGT